MNWKQIFTLCVIFNFGTSSTSFAQLDLPQPSPKAMVMQTVGLTEISITYSSPGVKNRTIWGDLVPYDEIWRTGANASTKINFSDEVTVGSTKIPAGEYALYTIPGASEWTIIINKNTKLWGVDGYKQEEDLVRVKVKAEKSTVKKERMAFYISPNENTGTVTLHWENLMVSFDVKVDVMSKAEANIKAKISEGERVWRYMYQAASFYKDQGDLDKALEYVNKSCEMKDYYYNFWMKGQILAAKGNYKEAVNAAEKALEIGPTLEKPFLDYFNNYKEAIEKDLAEWKKKK